MIVNRSAATSFSSSTTLAADPDLLMRGIVGFSGKQSKYLLLRFGCGIAGLIPGGLNLGDVITFLLLFQL
jgi:hypothetical protein